MSTHSFASSSWLATAATVVAALLAADAAHASVVRVATKAELESCVNTAPVTGDLGWTCAFEAGATLDVDGGVEFKTDVAGFENVTLDCAGGAFRRDSTDTAGAVDMVTISSASAGTTSRQTLRNCHFVDETDGGDTVGIKLERAGEVVIENVRILDGFYSAGDRALVKDPAASELATATRITGSWLGSAGTILTLTSDSGEYGWLTRENRFGTWRPDSQSPRDGLCLKIRNTTGGETIFESQNDQFYGCDGIEIAGVHASFSSSLFDAVGWPSALAETDHPHFVVGDDMALPTTLEIVNGAVLNWRQRMADNPPYGGRILFRLVDWEFVDADLDFTFAAAREHNDCGNIEGIFGDGGVLIDGPDDPNDGAPGRFRIDLTLPVDEDGAPCSISTLFSMDARAVFAKQPPAVGSVRGRNFGREIYGDTEFFLGPTWVHQVSNGSTLDTGDEVCAAQDATRDGAPPECRTAQPVDGAPVPEPSCPEGVDDGVAFFALCE